MQLKHPPLTSLIKIVTCATLILGGVAPSQAEDKPADPTGTWSWIAPGGERTNTAKLKLESGKVTGTVFFPERGARIIQATIEDGKLTGNEISFRATRELNGNRLAIKYSGKLTTDSIDGKMEYDRSGQPQSRKWEAKRQAEKK